MSYEKNATFVKKKLIENKIILFIASKTFRALSAANRMLSLHGNNNLSLCFCIDTDDDRLVADSSHILNSQFISVIGILRISFSLCEGSSTRFRVEDSPCHWSSQADSRRHSNGRWKAEVLLEWHHGTVDRFLRPGLFQVGWFDRL